jgi:hypothetical protein
MNFWLGDFGCVKGVTGQTQKTEGYTALYTAPEIVIGDNFMFYLLSII